MRNTLFTGLAAAFLATGALADNAPTAISTASTATPSSEASADFISHGETDGDRYFDVSKNKNGTFNLTLYTMELDSDQTDLAQAFKGPSETIVFEAKNISNLTPDQLINAGRYFNATGHDPVLTQAAAKTNFYPKNHGLAGPVVSKS